jgi:hypothetical protein
VDDSGSSGSSSSSEGEVGPDGSKRRKPKFVRKKLVKKVEALTGDALMQHQISLMDRALAKSYVCSVKSEVCQCMCVRACAT